MATRSQTSQPSVLAAMWKFRWFVLFLTIAFAGLGWLYASQTANWTAEATVNVQDPRTSNVFGQGSSDSPQRYVEGQVAIMQSRAVARRAVEIAAAQVPPVVVTVDEIVDGLDVSASSSSDIVVLGYTASTQREAIGVVNAVAAAYQDIGRQTADATFADTIGELEDSIAELESELVSLDRDLIQRQEAVIDRLTSDPALAAKQAQLDDLTVRLFELEAPSSGASDGAVTRFNTQFQILSLQIDTLSTDIENARAAILTVERESPERLALISEQTEAQRRLSELQSRRDQLAVDADLASSGVIFFSPAENAQPSGAGLYIVLGALLGLVIAAAGAMLFASRRRTFQARTEPEAVLGTRLLADVPNFRDERVRSLLPVADAPASASAEAFRFVSASMSLQQMWPAKEDGSNHYTSVMAVSSGLSEGKSVVTANTALAAAREGRRVLVMDTDFGNQQVTSLLVGSVPPTLGMTDVATGGATLSKAVVDIPHEGSGSIHLLARGSAPVKAPDFFAAPDTARLFEALKERYELVLIDAPPLLRVAYATTLARLADRFMVVVAHGSDVSVAEELRDQIELVGTPMIGYVYNLAPLRAEMTLSAGSMADTLGEYPTASGSVDSDQAGSAAAERR